MTFQSGYNIEISWPVKVTEKRATEGEQHPAKIERRSV